MITAKQMYGISSPADEKVQAWVTHGFTDSTLRSEPMGDLQWSMCVSCGAWLAIQTFEYLLYNRFDVTSTEGKEIYKLIKGSILFYKQYLEESKLHGGDVFTGPTTSPENSYRVKHRRGNVNVSHVEFMTISPALDVSVLRELSNIFTMLTMTGEMKRDRILGKCR